MPSELPSALLDRVRKLLAKAEAEGVTPAEAQALTTKAAELMAKYGIDRALLAASRPETDRPGNRIVKIYNPWARVQAHLLCGLADALRCQCILLPAEAGQRVHVFGYASDIERTDVLYTSVLVPQVNRLAASVEEAKADAALSAAQYKRALGVQSAGALSAEEIEHRRATSLTDEAKVKVA